MSTKQSAFVWVKTQLPLVVKINPHPEAKGDRQMVFKNTQSNFIETPDV